MTVFKVRNRKFLGSFCKEASVFEHVLDFLIDAVEGGTQRVRRESWAPAV